MSKFAWIRNILRRSDRAVRRPSRTQLEATVLEKRLAPAVVIGDFNGDRVPDMARTTADSTVRLYRGDTGENYAEYATFADWANATVSLAAGDFNGDGADDLAIAAGPGGGARVRVLDGRSGATLFDQFVFEPHFRGGLHIAAGDATGDSKAELFVGAGRGGAPRVRVLDLASGSTLHDFFAYESHFRGGAQVAAGDVNGDGRADLMTGAGVLGGPRVRSFDGLTGVSLRDQFGGDFARRDGITISRGDVDGNGRANLITLADGHLNVYAGTHPTPFVRFPITGPATVHSADLNGDGFDELLVDDGTTMRGYDGVTLAPNGFAWSAGSGAFATARPTPAASTFSSEAIRVPGDAGTTTLRVERLRQYTGAATEVGAFRVDTAAGAISTLLPGDAGYIAAALDPSRRVVAMASGQTTGVANVAAGEFFGLYLTTAAGTVTSFAASHPGRDPRILRLADNRFAVQETPSGGFEEFNAVIGRVVVGDPVPPPPPPTDDGNFAPDLTGYTPTDLGGTTGGTTVTNGVATLVEGDRFRVGLSRAFTVPSTPTAVKVTYEAPSFDTTSVSAIRDAFEIAVLGADGTPLALPTAAGRDAAMNWTEGFSATGGPATTLATNVATLNLAALPAGTAAQLVLRLVNNDGDTKTSVRIRRVDFVAAAGTAPSGVPTSGIDPAAGTLDLAVLTDVTPSLGEVYGRTTLTEENTILTTDLALRNEGNYTIRGEAAVVIGKLSDPSVGVLNPDGFTPDGRPYIRYAIAAGLAAGETTPSRLIRFSNPNREQFTYDVEVLAGLNRAPVLGPLADAAIAPGQAFATTASATDADGHALTFRLLASPEGMTIDAGGMIRFTPLAGDLGIHTVRVRVTDSLGLSAEGGFVLTVATAPPNRPPVFTSTPPNDATVASPFEVYSYATGPNPVAVTSGHFGTGVSIVTADPDDQLLRVHTGPDYDANKVSVGELDPALSKNHPLLQAAAVDLGIAPGTFNNAERDVYGFIPADVNADGNPDLVASVVLGANAIDSADTGTGYVVVRLGNGDGSFGDGWKAILPSVTVNSINYSNYAGAVRFVDATGDGIGDVLAVQRFGGRMLVYPGTGDGTFAAPIVSESTAHVVNFQVGDVNRDGKPDVVRFEQNFANRFRSGTSVLFGDGAGHFGSEVLYPALDREDDGYLVDADNTNGLDIVRLDYDGLLITRLNDGSGGFGPAINSGFHQPMTAQFGDFNGDGVTDAAVSRTFQSDGGIWFVPGNGDGTFGNAKSYELPNVQDIAAYTRGGDGVAPDLSGDGKPDILFGDTGTSGIVVAISDGTGQFTTQSYVGRMAGDIGEDIATNEADGPFVAAADWNRDGVMDVMVGRYRNGASAGAIGLALGDRPGTLRLPRTVPTTVSFNTESTLMADFNNDGIPDLLNHNRFNVTVSFGRGDGTFAAPLVGLNNGYHDNESMVAADFDRDGFTDIGFINGHSFVQAFGLGNGTFTYMPAVPYPAQYGYLPHGADYSLSGDFNRDGHPDLAFRLIAGGPANIFVLLYDPVQRRFNLLPDANGLLADASNMGTVGYADLDGDGADELFTHLSAAGGEPTRLVVWQTQGTNDDDAATLFTRTVVPTIGYGDFFPESFIVDDFNRDGDPDLAIGGAGTIRVGYGNGDFTFKDVVHYYAPGLSDLESGDVDGDGLTDLIANFSYNRRSSGLPGGGVYLGRADGTFAGFREFGGSGTDLSHTFLGVVRTGDANNDGRTDFVINLGGYANVFTAAPAGLAAVANGDLNGDGKSDLVAVNYGYDRVKVLLGDGDNGFVRQPDLFSDAGPVAVAVGDVTGDGASDFVTANRIGRSVSLFRASSSAFTRIDTDLEMRPDRVVLADLNGDGKSDVIAVGEETLSVLLGTTIGLGTAWTLPLSFAASGLTVADVTGDGTPDAVLTDAAGRLVVLPGLGDGTLGASKLTTLPAAVGEVAATDLNADGKQDIIVTFPGLGQIGILFGRGGGRFTTPQTITVGDTPNALAVSDVNGDGKPDLLVTNTGDGTLSVVLNRFDPSRLLRYAATATDPDGDPITFSLENGPGGMLFDEATGVAVWAPMPEQVGDNTVVLRAADGRGGYAEQGFTIRVTPANGVTPPVFASQPITEVAAGDAYRYQPRVAAAPDETLRYSLVNGPAGMTVDPITGAVNWDGRGKGLALAVNTSVTATPAFASGVGIVVPDAPTLRTASVTAEGWFKFDALAGFSDTLLAKRFNGDVDPSHIRSWGVRIDNGFLRAFTGHINGSGGNISVPGQLRTNQWYHIALTFDDATRTLSLYMNGTLVGSTVSAQALYYSDRPLEIAPFRAIAGTVADVRVWDRARTAAEIAAAMHREVPGDSPNLVLNFRFREGINASTVSDATANDHVGYLTNTFERYDFPGQVPALAPVGEHAVTIRVDDGKGGVRDQSFTLRVVPPFVTPVSGTVFADANGNGVQDRRAIDNLLVNGDFSSGAVGFASGLFPGTYTNASNSMRPGEWTMGLETRSLPGSNFEFEHTSRTGAALLVMATTTDTVAWSQTVPVTPGQTYDFGYWAFRTGTPARLQVRINGQDVGSVSDLATGFNHWWTRFAATWTATTAEARIEIVLLAATGSVGTALDDLTFLPTTAPRAVVPGSRELWLAGTPAGTGANGDSTPTAAPVAVPNLALTSGQVLTFTVAGGTHITPTPRSYTPDGVAVGVGIGAVNGLSGLITPVRSALVGVFLDDSNPIGQTPPETLNFQSGGNVPGGIDFTTLAPQLRQTFFIGDGKNAAGIMQQITVPAGATRLFLGTLDSGSNGDDPDGFEVLVFDAAQPVLDPGLAGRVVYVDRDGDGRLSAGEPTATTDATGLYAFALTGATAKVRIVPEAGRIPSHPASGFLSVDVSERTQGYDFALTPAAAGVPVFVSQPPAGLTVPESLAYAAFAASTDGSPITYRLAVGPAGAVVDAASGLVTWTAGRGDTGPNEFILTATDGAGQIAFQQFTVTVSANTPPTITSTPRTHAAVGVLFRHDVAAQDAESATLTVALGTAPAGMLIDAAGRITWTPAVTDLGTHTVEVIVRDAAGAEARQTFTVVVEPAGVNTPPVFVAGPRASAQVGVPFRSRLTATDADDDVLTFSVLDGPVGLTVTSDGFIAWTPATLGPVTIRAAVSDGRGGSSEQTYSVVVGTRPVTTTLSFTSVPPANGVLEQSYAYDPSAPGAAAFQLLAGPAGLSIDPVRGSVRWTPAANQLGPTSVTIRAFDETGATADQTWTITVRGSAQAPAFASTPPTIAAVGATYVYAAVANNPGGSPLTFALVSGPSGFSMNAETGTATWTPTADQTGPQAVVLQVRDGRGNFSTQAFEIVVATGLANQAPIPQSEPPYDATVGDLFRYTFAATDPEGAALAFAIVRGPAGMTIDPANGVVNWTPTASDLGTVTVTLAARDPQGAAAVQSFRLDVLAPNQAPTIVNTPPGSVPQGGIYRYDIRATDPDREPLFFRVVSGPAGMTVDALGRVRWETALDTPLGEQPATVRVTDSRGAMHERSFTVTVVPDTTAPRVSIAISPSLIYPWSAPALVRVTATDDVGIADIRVLLEGVPVALAADGTFRVPYTAPGQGRIQVFATDAAGNEGRAAARVTMRTGLENDPNNNPGDPTATLALAEGAAVGGRVAITGTAASPDFDRYTLSVRRSDADTFTSIATGTTAVTNGSLGVWDTTMLENDSYLLRLEVFDLFGGSATVERTVGVQGDFKLGNFRLSFSDMTIPVAGIPITLARTYDTLRADREGDVGFGWRFEFRNTDLRTSLPRTGLEDMGIFPAFRPGTRVNLTLPGGRREGFTFSPEIRVLPGYGGQGLVIATPRFTSDRGVSSTLSAGTGNLLVNEFGELHTAAGIPWNPASPDFGGYTLTTQDGTRYHIDGTGHLTTATDRNGNAVVFSESGVSGSGVSVLFERDARSRITRATDPAGNSVQYAYDHRGDLVSVTDREGHQTQITYKATPAHYLDTIVDPLGRTGVRTDYGPDGRLMQVAGANGAAVSFSYDPANNIATTLDPLGNPTVTEYDARGNTVGVTDALGGATRYSHDADDRVISETDPLGGVTRYTYDAAGNKSSITNTLGHTTWIAHDSRGTVTALTNPLGASITLPTDANGNTTAITDALGRTTGFSLANGAVQATFPNGGQTRITHQNGLPHQYFDEFGNALTLQYSLSGDLTGLQSVVSTASGPQTIGQTLIRDANGRLIAVIDALGHRTHYEYDAVGNITARIDRLGRRTEYSYDLIDRLIRTRFADGTEERAVYDLAGRMTASIDRGGRETRYEYDAVGRLTATLFPDTTPLTWTDNPRERSEYDLAGRRTAAIDELGNRTELGYDAMGNRVQVRDAANVVTTQTFNPIGQLIAATDGLGKATQFTRDAQGRVTAIRHADDSVVSATYDARDKLASVTDSGGATMNYEYDLRGRLTAAIDPLGNRTTYGYDELGRHTRTTDALGRITRFEYDAEGRLTAHQLPSGERETSTYDAEGRRLSHTDFAGGVTTFAYDLADRVISETYPDGLVTIRTYTPTGQTASVSDSRGAVTFTYDERDRMLSRTEPDGRAIQYAYDAVGNLVSRHSPSGTTSYTYDALNREITATDTAGAVATTYDAAGRIVTVSHPNGTLETYSRDLLGRATTIEISRGGTILDRWQYSFTAAGHVASATDLDGGRQQYSYDAAGRMLSETNIDPVNGTTNTGYTYDAVNNRLSQTQGGGTTNFAYDSRDRLTSQNGPGGAVLFSYDANGRLTAKTAAVNDKTTNVWDGAGRLVQATIITPGGTNTRDYKYDGDGNLVERTENGVVTRLLVDSNREHAQIIEESTPGQILTTFAYAAQTGRLHAQTVAGSRQEVHVDRLGSVRLLTNSAGLATDRVTYSAFGNVAERTGAMSLAVMFAGERRDSLTGFDFLRARHYDPTSGRFLSRDPFAGLLNQPISQNDYIYGNQNPLMFTDPTGRSGQLIDTQVAIAIVGSLVATTITGATVGSITAKLFGYPVAEGFKIGALGGLVIGTIGTTIGLATFAPISQFLSAFAQRALTVSAQGVAANLGTNASVLSFNAATAGALFDQTLILSLAIGDLIAAGVVLTTSAVLGAIYAVVSSLGPAVPLPPQNP